MGGREWEVKGGREGGGRGREGSGAEGTLRGAAGHIDGVLELRGGYGRTAGHLEGALYQGLLPVLPGASEAATAWRVIDAAERLHDPREDPIDIEGDANCIEQGLVDLQGGGTVRTAQEALDERARPTMGRGAENRGKGEGGRQSLRGAEFGEE